MIREDRGRKRKLQPRGEKYKRLLDNIKTGIFNCKFLTSDWAITEIVAAVRDRAILKSFLFDGHEMSAFAREKRNYLLEEEKRIGIHEAIRDFVQFLHRLHIEIVKINLNVQKIHEYSMKYSIETPDTVHVVTAIEQSCGHLVTVDRALIDSKVKEIAIIDPDTLFTRSELRH
jgi:predicted nucleic acid-binding protein